MLASAFTWRTRLRALAVGLWRKAVRRQERRYRPRTDGERRPEVAPGCRASSVAQLADGGEAFALLAGGAGRCAPLDGSGHCLAVMDRGSGFEGPPRAAASRELRQGDAETRALKSRAPPTLQFPVSSSKATGLLHRPAWQIVLSRPGQDQATGGGVLRCKQALQPCGKQEGSACAGHRWHPMQHCQCSRPSDVRA